MVYSFRYRVIRKITLAIDSSLRSQHLHLIFDVRAEVWRLYPIGGHPPATCLKKRVNRFLLRERYEPKDLFDEIKPYINLTGGIISVDDTIADKPYSNPDKTELLGYFWSGKHHQVFKGINIVSLYYRDPSGKSVPVNYRIYDKKEGKTKNDYFREMFEEFILWGLKPWLVTGDSWYSSLENLKFRKN